MLLLLMSFDDVTDGLAAVVRVVCVCSSRVRTSAMSAKDSSSPFFIPFPASLFVMIYFTLRKMTTHTAIRIRLICIFFIISIEWSSVEVLYMGWGGVGWC